MVARSRGQLAPAITQNIIQSHCHRLAAGITVGMALSEKVQQAIDLLSSIASSASGSTSESTSRSSQPASASEVPGPSGQQVSRRHSGARAGGMIFHREFLL